jgi:MFS family permease
MAEPLGVSSAVRSRFLGSYGRDFRLYASARAVSAVGDRIATIVLIFLIVRQSASFAPALALFYVCRVLPSLFGGLLAGAIADRFDRKRLMVLSDLGRAVVLVVVPSLTVLTLWALYPLVIVLYGLTVLFSSSSQAALPDVVPEAQLLGANAVLSGISTAADFAYAAGGILIVVLKYRIPFYIDAATFVFSAAMIVLMHIPAQPRVAWSGVAGVVDRIREGGDFLLRQASLKWTTLVLTIAAIAGGAEFVVIPLYAQHALAAASRLPGPLRSGAFRFSVLEVCLGMGALAGSWLTTRLAASWPRGRIFGLGVIGLGLFDAMLFLTGNVYIAALISILSGLCNSLFIISGVTLTQTLTPSDLRGRVTSTQATIITASLAIGSALAGPLLLLVSSRLALLILGIVIALTGLLVWLRPSVRNQP